MIEEFLKNIEIKPNTGLVSTKVVVIKQSIDAIKDVKKRKTNH